MPTTALPRGAHLVGSVNIPDAETTFRTVGATLGNHLKRLPDGEVGERFHWIAFQPGRLARNPGIEQVGEQPFRVGSLDVRPVKFSEGVDPASVEIQDLGYAQAAIESWQIFEQLQTAGQIPSHLRFQVSLPTPLAVAGAFVVPEHQAVFEPVYQRALLRELQQILDAIPHQKLTIQWDLAVEFGFIEAVDHPEVLPKYVPWFEDLWGGIFDRVATLASSVPEEVELGFHLCYGDVAEKHFIEPADTANIARVISGLVEHVKRPIAYIHLPVPIERDDAAYFAALSDNPPPESIELYLGLIHREDGVAGAQRRLAAAYEAGITREFGVGTECGCGRSPQDQTEPLLQTHAQISQPWVSA